MIRPNFKPAVLLIGVFVLVWAALRFLFPLLLPFLLGIGLALAAEPLVHLAEKRLRLPRGVAAALGSTLTLLLLLGILVIAGSLLVKELTLLAGIVPNLTETARKGLQLLEDFLLGLTGRMPEGVRPVLTHTVLNLFNSGSAIMDRVTARIPSMASALLTRVPNGALTAGTAILSGFMLSARLPKLRGWLRRQPSDPRLAPYTGAAGRIRKALGGWLRAQLTLSGLSFGILCIGFWILGIPYAPIWAFLIALVDAVPVLGTGTVLLPWSLVCFLQQASFRAVGLLILYATTLVTRTMLEPRLVGKQLGLDPLVTLIALYAGYRIWGIPGMLLSPLLSVAALELATISRN